MDQAHLSVLTPDERQRMIDGALALLADIGVEVEDDTMKKRFAKAGSRVDQTGRVRLPKELARELLSAVPATQVRETIGGRRIILGSGGQLVNSLILDPVIVDYEEGPRPPRFSDVSLHARLGDALPLVNSTYKMDQGLEGMTSQQSNIRSLGEFLCNTTNHVMAAPADKTSLAVWIEMLEVVLDGATFKERPIVTFIQHVKTPLRLPEFECAVIATATSRDIPLTVGSCPMAGATSPFTLAGTLMLAVAETIFNAAAVQLCKTAHPIQSGSSLFTFNMKAGALCAGGVESELLEVGYVELMRELRLPANITCSFNDPNRVDYQSGVETASKCMSSVLANPDIIGGIGSIANARGVSAEKILLDHDVLEMAMRFRQGIRVDSETLAAETIRQVGPGGNYMCADHTMAHLRSGEHYYGGLFQREGRSDKTMLERAHERVKELFGMHQPDVPEVRQEALRREAKKIEANLT